jgi:hypothetical protein
VPEWDGRADNVTVRSMRIPGLRTAIGLAVLITLSLVCLEATARLFFWIEDGVPLRHPDRALYLYYPELRDSDEGYPSRDGQSFDVLLLGESVLHPDWGEVAQALREALAFSGRRDVRIFNLAKPAHTSRDSWLKYAAIPSARFRLVVVYDGMNETRANNVPPDLYRDNYSHYSWYEGANAIAPYHGNARFVLPYTGRYIVTALRAALHSDRYVPTNSPIAEWEQYAARPRSPESLRQNLENIVRVAHERGDPLMLMTFATYVPANYSKLAFRAKALDYGTHLSALEIWGAPQFVRLAIDQQNAVIRDLASRHHEVLFVDQARLMTGSNRYFNDPCHLTVAGSSVFAQHIVDALDAARPPSAGAAAPGGD